MRIAILGAGPAGLYLAYLIKRRRPDADIALVEQNPADATFGFGVVFSDRALEFLREDDAQTFTVITPQMESWDDMTLVHRNERIVIDGIGFAAIGRLKLLQLLQQRVRSVGIAPEFSRAVTSLEQFKDADLVVGADGVNSLVRRTFTEAFDASVSYGANHFAWFGTSQPYDTLTQTFRHTPIGDFNAHHYRYASGRSTFIVEIDEATFARAGFERMEESESRSLCQKIFADALGGHPLISNNSIWRRFPQVRNARWHYGKYVLIGDALHTAHFSIGSGTRLAMEDAIALDKALAAHGDDVAAALPAFEAARRPILDKIVAGANASAAWYENFAEHMQLAPTEFAMSYITRSGRIDIERLRKLSPRFVERYEREQG
ncbi:MAG TPA: FAD-dependent monooxygenase [Pseudolabrys sp.]|jgi:2-polyprenyl-6-methoxyphenol hydroxylase-like FAD-dependent oxidoreductase